MSDWQENTGFDSAFFTRLDQILALEYSMETLFAYLTLKVEQRDYHGIWDAAIELEKLQGMINVLQQRS